jgi:hypothetical protein
VSKARPTSRQNGLRLCYGERTNLIQGYLSFGYRYHRCTAHNCKMYIILPEFNLHAQRVLSHSPKSPPLLSSSPGNCTERSVLAQCSSLTATSESESYHRSAPKTLIVVVCQRRAMIRTWKLSDCNCRTRACARSNSTLRASSPAMLGLFSRESASAGGFRS